MNRQPLISIIMNCYNGESYLQEAIESIMAQSYTRWEIIFWDNQSKDSSAAIANSFSDSRINYYLAKKHTNLGMARNMALDKTNGDWIAFLDVDDLWQKDKLEKQVALINEINRDIGFVYGRCEVIYSNQKKPSHVLKQGYLLPEGFIFDELIFENFVPFVSAVVNKKKFMNMGGFHNDLQHSTDYYMFLKLAEKFEAYPLQEVCCKYRVHDHNLTNIYRIQGELESIQIVSSFLPSPNVEKAIIYHYAGLAIAYLREKEIVLFLRSLLRQGVFIRFLKRAFDAIRKK